MGQGSLADLAAGEKKEIAGGRRTRGDGGFGGLGHREARSMATEEKGNGRAKPLGAGFMRPPRGHRTLFIWHRTRTVTTGLMRREV